MIWAPPAELGLPWILAEQEMVMLTLHDNISNVFITILCLPMGEVRHMDFTSVKEKSVGLQDIILATDYVLRKHS